MRFEQLIRFVERLSPPLSPTQKAETLNLWQEVRLEVKSYRGIDRVARAKILRGLELSGASTVMLEYAEKTLPMGTPSMLQGESWLLLAGAGGGMVTRIKACAPQLREDQSWLGEDSRLAGIDASEGLSRILAELGLGGPPDRGEPNLPIMQVPDFRRVSRVSGASLGLAACIAHLSEWTSTPADESVAGSARVDERGRLHRVESIREKLDALRRCWPGVNRLVVAKDQLDVPTDTGVTILFCETLAEAWTHFGVAPKAALNALPFDQLRLLIDALPQEGQRVADREALTTLALRTLNWSAICEQYARTPGLERATTMDCRNYQVKALGFAAIFAMRAGYAGAAARHLATVEAMIRADEVAWSDLELEVQVSIEITRATSAINRGDNAVPIAERALFLARTLTDKLRGRMTGKAVGTLGRARLHAGDPTAACELLEQSVEFHRDYANEEEPRSRCYLATARRMSGDPGAALAEVDGALELTAKRSMFSSSRTTRLFLFLEKGRCELELRRPEAALLSFDEVIRGQLKDDDYPRIAALRGRAAALGQTDRRRLAVFELTRCLEVAKQESPRSVTGQIAALAAADILLAESGAASAVLRPNAANVWSRHWPDDVGEVGMRAVLRRAVY